MLGSNVPTVGGLLNGFRYAEEWRCDCIQVYLTPSRTWDVPALTEEFVQSFKSAWRGSSVSAIVSHIPFLVNLASPSADIRAKSERRLATEIAHADALGVRYLVLHPGSAGGQQRRAGLRFIIDGLNVVLDGFGSGSPLVLLETMAGQGSSLGSFFEELALILEGIERPDLVGVCFDTAHVFAAGYDFRGYDGYARVLESFERAIGLSRIRVIHLNDSKANLGSCLDRHAAVGEGLMGMQVFHALLTDAQFNDIPKILEIPDRDTKSESTLELLRALQSQKGQICPDDPLVYQLPLWEVHP